MSKLNQRGFSIPTILSFMLVAAIVTLSSIQIVLTNFFVVGNNIKSQKAFNISEAGLNYYLWHLSHNATDFKDGKTTPATPDPNLGYGPYVHDYIDDNAVKQGTFTLWIKPQGSGSTVATVRSIGQVKGSGAKRTTEAKIGAASFASYGLVADTALWFGNTEASDGPVHSNQGIRMDGSSNADVTSANSTYVPPSTLGGDGNSHPGVWCSNTVTSPVNCATRSKTDWHYPVTSVDFNQVSGSLCTMKKAAFADNSATASLATQTNACTQTPTTRTSAYVPQSATNGSFSATKGYLIELNSNSTYNLYKVTAETDTAATYATALTKTSVATNIALPPSGVIFVEDNVWVRTNPTFSGRVNIGAGRLASSTYSANVNIADDVLYGTKNGSDSIGLVAQNSVILEPYAPPATGSFTFEVDAASLAEAGSVTYPSVYQSNSNKCSRGWVNDNQKFVYYGSIASRQTWTWTWQRDNSCADAVLKSGTGYISGILNNTTQYDYNLMYAPPPSYPITGGYNILSWREVLTRP
jgi:Tfp pilus assembly protein PilX